MTHGHDSGSAKATARGFSRAAVAMAQLRAASTELVASNERLSEASTALRHAASGLLAAASQLVTRTDRRARPRTLGRPRQRARL